MFARLPPLRQPGQRGAGDAVGVLALMGQRYHNQLTTIFARVCDCAIYAANCHRPHSPFVSGCASPLVNLLTVIPYAADSESSVLRDGLPSDPLSKPLMLPCEIPDALAASACVRPADCRAWRSNWPMDGITYSPTSIHALSSLAIHMNTHSCALPLAPTFPQPRQP